jgi:Zn-dependent metalloprotease
MKHSLPIDAKIIRDETNHTIIFLKGRNLSAALESDAHFSQVQAQNDAAAIAKAFIDAYREEFRLIDPVTELAAASVVTDDLGLTHVRFQQSYQEIPVSASEIIVHLDRDKHVYLVNGRYIPTPDHLNIQPHITLSDAQAVAAKHLERDRADCPRCVTNLIIFPKPGNGALLAFRVEALIRADEGWIYFIDAHSGLIIERQTSIRTSP